MTDPPATMPRATACNPIIAGLAPDPSICRRGDDYYLVTTSFNYRPGLPVYHSRDLASWRLGGHVLTSQTHFRLPRTGPSEGIMAATIRYADDWFYVTTTNTSYGGNFVVRSRDPLGGWSEPLWIDRSGIDPGIAFCDDGRVVLATTATGGGVAADPAQTDHGIVVSEIDLGTGRCSELRTVTHGWLGQYPEGPRFVRRGQYWYLLLAEGGSEFGHMVTVARGIDPTGPFEPCPHNPILTHRSQLDRVQGAGHADMVEAADGSWWLVCLGFRPTGDPLTHVLGRETFLCPVVWVDDWPVAGTAGRLPSEVQLPWTPDPVGDVNGSIHGWTVLRWATLGVVAPGAIDVATDGDVLRLVTGPPVDGAIGTVRLVPQRHHRFVATVWVSCATPGGEAGLTIWMDAQHRYEVGVAAAPDSRPGLALEIVTRRQIGTLVGERRHPVTADRPVRLWVGSDGIDYTMGRIDERGRFDELDRGGVRYLSSEVAGGFTGMMLGPYAAGRPGSSAQFSTFEYLPHDAA
jgi:alpha-N-arabinofuranosidase